MEFVKRNLPVIIIGLLTLVIFVGIIIAGQRTQNTGPTLVEVDETQLIAEHTYITGNPNGQVLLVEFSDFECPACGAAHPIVKQLLAKYAPFLKFAYRHYPLPQHAYAKKAAEAAQIAGEQGKFWEYHDTLFANQNNLAESNLVNYAKELGLDINRFETDLTAGTFEGLINKDIKAGNALGVNSTPTFFLNDRRVILNSFNELDALIQDEIDKLGLEIQTNEATESTKPTEITENSTDLSENLKKALSGTLEPLVINYTEEGFSPKSSRAYAGQTVIWINTTDKPIFVKQKTPYFDELGEGFPLEPGESFSFELYKDRQWSFEERTTYHYGSIFIDKLPE